ncbi:Maf family protein [Candidatus Dependentiae bacterium]|nr:Maf family protein [Candidatus Dependentiae bacterium]
METHYTLYLASQSLGRQELLREAQIPFSLISQNTDESLCSLQQPLEIIVKELALEKMNNIEYPSVPLNTIALFLTADTLTLNSDNIIYCKPKDKQEAITMLKSARNGIIAGTAFCLTKKQYTPQGWIMLAQIIAYDQTKSIINVPDELIECYLSNIPFLTISSGLSIEGFGEQFCQEVHGCYSTVLGLPMFKVRQALFQLGFYKLS